MSRPVSGSSLPVRLAVAVAALLLAAPAHALQPQQAPQILSPRDDGLTVADAEQATGLRLALPLPNCDELPSECDELRLLNTLDGFDLDPRVEVVVPEGVEVDPAEAEAAFAFTPLEGGADAIPGDRVVYDPATRVLSAHPDAQLAEGTRYRLEVALPGLAPASSEFTTLTASAGLLQMRRRLDDGSAYRDAGIDDAQRRIDFTQGDLRTTFAAPTVAMITRFDEVDPDGELVSSTVPNSAVAGAGTYAFGSLTVPRWLDENRVIQPAPTGGAGPAPTGSERIGVTLILPAGDAPEGGFPVAIFGPGITRSKADLFLAADLNAARGLATLSFDPAGHGFGPRSEFGVTSLDPRNGGQVRFSSFGRGRDLDGDGTITNQEGVSAPDTPHPLAPVALRDGLRQSALDVMAIVRAIGLGVDVDGDGAEDLRRDDVRLYAQSLGGIYGTMVMASDPLVGTAVLNVPGGPITDIARLSPVFRSEVADALRDRLPNARNGGVNRFDEALPLRLDPPRLDPPRGATEIQSILARQNAINRPGSPEALAPLIRRTPPPDSRAKEVIYQIAFGDETVPNPTSATLVRAFGELDRVTLYRNDRTASAPQNPHGFLLDPRIQGRDQGQAQVVEYLTSGGAEVLDPDGPGPTFEVPVADPDVLEIRNYDDSDYAEPEATPFERYAGADRVGTALEVSRRTVAETATVVVARADDYADALAGGPLAAALDAPLLLTGSGELSGGVAEEMARLGATQAVLLGGPAALAPAVEDAVRAAGLETRRVAGGNRFATAAAIAGELPDGGSGEVFLAEGIDEDPARGWPDALSAGGIAAALGRPVLLTTTDSLPSETAALLGGRSVTVVGGPAAVSDAVFQEVAGAAASVSRLAGPDRYATSALVARAAVDRGVDPTEVWSATGTAFPDGLVAGATAGRRGAPLVLVDGGDPEGAEAVRRLIGDEATTVRALGGPAAISIPVEGALRELTDPPPAEDTGGETGDG